MPIRDGFIQEEGVVIGENLDTGYNVILRKGAIVKDNVCLWSNTVIDPGAVIGNGVKIHANCYVCQGAVIEDDVFIGPGTQLLNDRYPPRYDSDDWEPPIIRKGAVIGGGVTIGPGVTIEENAKIGAGAVVIRNVPVFQVWAGNPAKRIK